VYVCKHHLIYCRLARSDRSPIGLRRTNEIHEGPLTLGLQQLHLGVSLALFALVRSSFVHLLMFYVAMFHASVVFGLLKESLQEQAHEALLQSEFAADAAGVDLESCPLGELVSALKAGVADIANSVVRDGDDPVKDAAHNVLLRIFECAVAVDNPVMVVTIAASQGEESNIVRTWKALEQVCHVPATVFYQRQSFFLRVNFCMYVMPLFNSKRFAPAASAALRQLPAPLLCQQAYYAQNLPPPV
jgi:hypothetical protein